MDLSKLSDADLEAVAAGDMTKVSDEGLTQLAGPTQQFSPQEQNLDEPGFASRAFDYGLRALDYAGGLGRTAVGAGLGTVTGQDVVREGDVARAFQGQAPTSATYLERAGLPEGGKINLMPEVKIPLTDVTLGQGESSARDIAGFGLDVLSDPLTYATFGTSGLAKKALTPVSSASKKLGETLYKAGLTRVDQEALRYGKEAPSQLLLQEGIWGRARTIEKKMNELASRLKERRDLILKKATRAGGETSMVDAMKPLLDEVAKIKSSKDPKLQGLAKAYEKEAAKYLALDAVPEQKFIQEYPTSEFVPGFTPIEKIAPSKQQFVELPYTTLEKKSVAQPEILGYEATGKAKATNLTGAGNRYTYLEQLSPEARTEMFEPTLVNPKDQIVSLPQGAKQVEELTPKLEVGAYQEPQITFGKTIPEHYRPGKPMVDWATTERIPGPTPIQTSGYKTTAGAKLSQSDWLDNRIRSADTKLTKALQEGLRRETEKTVGQKLGKAAENELISTNEKLGRILTTREKQELEAIKEAKKSPFTRVDAMLAGNALGDPTGRGLLMSVAKKASDITHLPAFQTGVGLGMERFGGSRYLGPLTDIAARRGYASPWLQMNNEEN